MKGGTRTLTFGGQLGQSMGTIDVLMPVSNGHILRLELDVVELNIPLLIGLNMLEKH